jgi:phenylpyruvate tautomerase PptA (4-oxalocrotonate tautomerase family)
VPLIEIHALPRDEPTDVERVVRRVSSEVASALGARPDAVWVTWTTIDGCYAVGDAVRAKQPRDTHAPIVHVHARRTAAEVEAIRDAVERALVDELDLAEGNVFVTVRPVFALDPAAAG